MTNRIVLNETSYMSYSNFNFWIIESQFLTTTFIIKTPNLINRDTTRQYLDNILH